MSLTLFFLPGQRRRSCQEVRLLWWNRTLHQKRGNSYQYLNILKVNFNMVLHEVEACLALCCVKMTVNVF